MTLRLKRSSSESERDINRTLDGLRVVLKKFKGTTGSSDPDFQDGELGIFEASQTDNRLILKWKGKYWSFLAVSTNAPVDGTSVTALTDSTGGTANNTLTAISGSGADAAINNNFADLASKVNELRTVLVNLGYVR